MFLISSRGLRQDIRLEMAQLETRVREDITQLRDDIKQLGDLDDGATKTISWARRPSGV